MFCFTSKSTLKSNTTPNLSYFFLKQAVPQHSIQVHLLQTSSWQSASSPESRTAPSCIPSLDSAHASVLASLITVVFSYLAVSYLRARIFLLCFWLMQGFISILSFKVMNCFATHRSSNISFPHLFCCIQSAIVYSFSVSLGSLPPIHSVHPCTQASLFPFPQPPSKPFNQFSIQPFWLFLSSFNPIHSYQIKHLTTLLWFLFVLL